MLMYNVRSNGIPVGNGNFFSNAIDCSLQKSSVMGTGQSSRCVKYTNISRSLAETYTTRIVPAHVCR